MKRILLCLCLLLPSLVFADAKSVLQQRLAKVEGFSALFSQQVKTADGDVMQEGKGELLVNRPNYFLWQINQPDVTKIVSDGKNMWIYSPEVEQVTIMSLNQVIDNRLLMLITDSHNVVWQDYQVTRQQNSFSLKPTDGSLQQYKITVLPTGMIVNFAIIEEDGQQSDYELSHQKLGKIDKEKFIFTIPQGVMVDDQRE